MKLGFLGCGTIAAAMIEGLVTAGHDAVIHVSPRNAGIASGLAARFPNVVVAPDNQALLDRSDLVIVAVRPQIVEAVLAELVFRPEQRVLSLVAATSLDRLRAATAPAREVLRAVPLPAVARHLGATALYPASPEMAALLGKLGSVVALAEESEFDIFTAATAMMASHFAMAEAVAGWMAGKGVAADKARAFYGGMLLGLADTAAVHPERSFAELADEHQTAGGINEQVRGLLTEAGVFNEVGEALDAVAERLRKAH
jgi:pyrroline-5-carboxylate reductase